MNKQIVYRLEVMIINFDQLSEPDIVTELENANYGNDCIRPEVISIEGKEIEWSDEHPLNRKDTTAAAFRELFAATPSPSLPQSAPDHEQIKKELVKYFGDYAQAEMAYSICFNRGLPQSKEPVSEGGINTLAEEAIDKLPFANLYNWAVVKRAWRAGYKAATTPAKENKNETQS